MRSKSVKYLQSCLSSADLMLPIGANVRCPLQRIQRQARGKRLAKVMPEQPRASLGAALFLAEPAVWRDS